MKLVKILFVNLSYDDIQAQFSRTLKNKINIEENSTEHTTFFNNYVNNDLTENESEITKNNNLNSEIKELLMFLKSLFKSKYSS